MEVKMFRKLDSKDAIPNQRWPMCGWNLLTDALGNRENPGPNDCRNAVSLHIGSKNRNSFRACEVCAKQSKKLSRYRIRRRIFSYLYKVVEKGKAIVTEETPRPEEQIAAETTGAGIYYNFFR